MTCPSFFDSAIKSAIASAFFAGLILQAAVVNPSASDRVKVCVTGDGEHFVLAQAEEIAGRIFAGIGIHLEWYHDGHHCKAPTPDFLNVLVTVDALDTEEPGALAYSRLHENPHIEVFYDRIVHAVEPPRRPKLLAHVLAHEIAHMLAGTGRHSDAGIMKAHWSNSDLFELSGPPMSFTPADAELIQQGMRSAPRF
jgi:hypothetical protein